MLSAILQQPWTFHTFSEPKIAEWYLIKKNLKNITFSIYRDWQSTLLLKQNTYLHFHYKADLLIYSFQNLDLMDLKISFDLSPLLMKICDNQKYKVYSFWACASASVEFRGKFCIYKTLTHSTVKTCVSRITATPDAIGRIIAGSLLTWVIPAVHVVFKEIVNYNEQHLNSMNFSLRMNQ